MGPEVLIVDCFHGVNSAPIKASADEKHRLIIVTSHVSSRASVPGLRNFERWDKMQDLLILITPSALFKFFGRDSRSAQKLLYLVTRLLGMTIKDAQKLTSKGFSHYRWRFFDSPTLFVQN